MLEVSFFVSFISKVKTQLYVTFERHMRTYKCSKRIYSLLSLSLISLHPARNGNVIKKLKGRSYRDQVKLKLRFSRYSFSNLFVINFCRVAVSIKVTSFNREYGFAEISLKALSIMDLSFRFLRTNI